VRITILTPYYPPEMGAPPARLSELAVRLKASGHEVTVVTAFPNRPQGRIIEGYRGRWRMMETMEEVRVIRTWIIPAAASASFLNRLVTDLSFMFSSGLMTARLLGRQDVLIVQNPPVFSVFSARYLKWRTGAKVVIWCGDVWPDVLIQSGQLANEFQAKLMRRVQKYGFTHSDLVTLTNPTIAEEIKKTYQCSPVTVWSNGVDTTMFSPSKWSQAVRERFGAADGDLLIGYMGLHGRFQGLDVILDAAEILHDRKDLHFVFIGEGVEKKRLQEKVKNLRLDNVVFFDQRPKKEMPDIVASIDISIVSLLTRMPGTMPSKFYEALASGTIPLTADGCEAAPLVTKFQAGLLYEPKDAQSVANAILSFVKMNQANREVMRKNVRDLALRFDRNRLSLFVENTLNALVEGSKLPDFNW